MATELHPPEFATFAAHVPDIIRPKPRRLSDVRNVIPSSPRPPGDGAPPALDFALDLNCADLENDVFRDDTDDCTPLRPLQRNLAGGSAPALHRSFSKPRPHTPHVAPPTNTLVANREKFAGVDLNDCENVETRTENSSSASNTDSLSSTEKGEVRRRPLPQRMKQRRRNILSFPQSLDLLLQQQKSRYDSSGHASMTESTASEYALSKENVDSFDPEQLMEKLTITGGTTRSIRSAVSTDSEDQATHPAAKKVAARVVHQSSMETVATNLTSSAADEFVWLDPAYRLVQLQRAPWDVIAVQRVIENSTKLKDVLHRIAQDAIPKLAFLLQRPLVRIAREAQRFARAIGVCGKSEITGALWVVLPPWLANNCVKACHRAAAIFGGASCSRQSKSSRAGLFFSVGSFHRWTMDAGLAPFIPEMAAVFLAAALENLLEEVVFSCLRCYETLTAATVDSALCQSGDLYGLFQSCTHLTMSRSSTGIPILPKWPVQVPQRGDEHSMLTTCVASVGELEELLQKALHLLNMAMRPAWGQHLVRWSSAGTRALYYYTRCSQLEHSQYGHQRASSSLSPDRSQLLPPIIEWVRVASAFTVYRHHSFMVDENDVLQAARILLPGVDCPIRAFGLQQDPIEFLPDKINGPDGVRLLNLRTAMRLLGTSTRLDIVHSVLKQVPNGVNTVSEEGLTALMIAALRGDDATIKCLISAGAELDLQTPGQTVQSPGARPECQFWTALTYAVAQGNVGAAKALLEAGAQVEAGGETYPTDTPLQLAVAAAHNDMITLLLSFGAHPYLSTMTPDNQCYAQGLSSLGTPSPVAVAAAHGHRSVLHRLVSHPIQGSSPQTAVSLEEILSEGSQSTLQRKTRQYKFSKNQWRCLQEAMYHSAENGFLEITLDLRNMGVCWTLHSWSKSLMTCHLQQHEAALNEILQDFQMAWTTQESTTLLTEETFPLMFELMSCSKNEAVTLAIVNILSQCFGREPLESIPLPASRLPGPRIDPRYVNSPEMADVRFVVEGKSFFGHRIILVNASERFKEMLAAGGSDQVVTIKDIRYPIFQMVMEYLYKGGFDGIAVSPQDALELLTAANYFQLTPLVTYCEHICTKTVNVDNIVSVFIHARVYHASQLLRYCLGFMLQNLVTLMSYDNSFRKLLSNPEDHGDLLNRLKYALQRFVLLLALVAHASGIFIRYGYYPYAAVWPGYYYYYPFYGSYYSFLYYPRFAISIGR